MAAMVAQLFSEGALLLAPVLTLVASVQTELLAFLVAAAAHWILFGKHRIIGRPSGVKSAQDVPRVANTSRSLGRGGSPTAAGACSRAAATPRAAAVTAVAGRSVEEFRALPEKTSVHYNAFMEDRIRGGDYAAAREAFADARGAGLVDTTAFNTILKVDLLNGDLDGARRITAEMKSSGVSPNCTTFNELINLAVTKGEQAVWPLFDEMTALGVKPNHVTFSILLKFARTTSKPRHLDRVLAMVDVADEHMDDVLLGSLVEACVRAGRADKLRRAVDKRCRSEKGLNFKTAHGYGSIIRACGYLKDMPHVWAAWDELRERKLELSSITIGCMVEAVAMSGDPQAAHGLIRELLADAHTRPLVNAVIYCSVLKGFSHQKRFQKVWEVYEEMTKEGMQLTIVTYNTLVDACARSCSMSHVQKLLEAMSNQGIRPNIVTYSAIIKGYCQDSRVDAALEVFREMRQTAGLEPDEHTYNTLINGCARQQLCDQGLKLLDDMVEVGVAPSNYTLSVLVKLLGRARQPRRAFEVCEELCEKFGLRLNSHVYNNLVNACLQNSGLLAGIEVFRKMLGEHIAPDARTYTLLINAAVSERRPMEAAGLLQASAGKAGAYASPLEISAHVPRALLRPHDGLPCSMIKETIASIARHPGCQDLAETLRRELKSA